jgi:ABC-2 type transport system ATP-binding protein
LNLGEIIGVVGENGNGKTTFLRIMAGELAISAGNIHFHLLDNLKPDPYTIRQNVSFVPQRIPRWHGYLKDNLHFSASISGLKGEENEVMVDFMLERLDLSRYANHTWDQISSGYKTRFEIARVLLQRPKLLILDEPLANLDINAQQTLLSDLRYIAKSQFRPMGVVLSSQQLFEVEKMADTVLFLKNGECLIESKETKNEGKYLSVLELETVFDREKLSSIFDSDTVISFNGGYFTLKSLTADTQQILGKLVSNHVPITYLRDITLSTKRFF